MRLRSGTGATDVQEVKDSSIADDLEEQIVDAIFRGGKNTATTADSVIW